MKELVMEWRHYEKDGATCDRCAATGKSFKDVVAELSTELTAQGISVIFTETVLPQDRMAESNMILLNGKPLEEILGDARSAASDCPSCACLTGSSTICRTIEHEGVVHEEIPAELIRKAVHKLSGLP